MKRRLLAAILLLSLCLSACQKPADVAHTGPDDTSAAKPSQGQQTPPADLGDDNTAFGEDLEQAGAYDGYFEGDSTDFTVEWESGTKDAWHLEGTTLTFTAIHEETVYSLTGTFRGNIVIDVGDDNKFDLELKDFSLVTEETNPILILSGEEVSVKAKKDTKNYIYDMRPAVDEGDETAYSGAIHSEVDLEIAGKGQLTVVSENNNGIHTKDDLQVKNLSLLVACTDNALKGNDSAELTDCTTTLIASAGDGIKTSNSDISSKGNQRGTVTINGGSHTIYAACDGIDAAYDVVIENPETKLEIFTDKYSNYSSEVTAMDEDQYYIRFTYDLYQYSVKYYNSDDDYCWVNAGYHSKVSGGRSTYYYYAFPKMSQYSKMQFFIYSEDMEQGQEEDYLVASDYLTPNAGYDTFALSSRGSSLTYTWTNYTTQIQEGGFGGMGGPGGRPGGGGFGGMGGGNTDKGTYSTKGIKAANQITITAGTISVKSYDDAIHAGTDDALENGETPLGNISIKGGNITLYTNDDGLHADGTVTVEDGTVAVTNAYEGVEGSYVQILGGNVSVNSSDDGINGTTTSGTAITISGGEVYIYCSGDGIDSNSRASYSGIVFSGGNSVVISNSGGNSAIDSEQGYAYTGGAVVAIMPQGGMSGEATHCQNFSQVGAYTQMTLNSGDLLIAQINGQTLSVQMPASMRALVIALGDSNAEIFVSESTTQSGAAA